MDSTFSTLGFVIFGFSITFYALVVQSQMEDGRGDELSNAFMVPSPSPPTLPPPPPPLPPPSPPPSLDSSPPRGSPPPPRAPSPHRAPPHQLSKHTPKMKRSPTPPNHHRPGHIPARPAHQMNAGKKVGLLFVGIAATMQIGMVGFLLFKRRQLLRTTDRYETCS